MAATAQRAFMGYCVVSSRFLAHDAGHRQLLAPRAVSHLIVFVGNLLLGHPSMVDGRHNNITAYKRLTSTTPNLDYPFWLSTTNTWRIRSHRARFIVKHQKIFFFPF
jgi:hypothetical protein